MVRILSLMLEMHIPFISGRNERQKWIFLFWIFLFMPPFNFFNIYVLFLPLSNFCFIQTTIMTREFSTKLTEKTVSYLKHLINLHLHWRNFSQLSKHNFNTFIFHLIYKERRKVNGLVWHKKVISAVILKASVRRNKLENWLGASPRAHYIT